MLDKVWMTDCINRWRLYPNTVSYFTDWLLKFGSYEEWLQIFQTSPDLPWGFIVFNIRESLEMRLDGIHVQNHYDFQLESIHTQNPIQDPIKNEQSWTTIKNRLMVLNEYPVIHVPAGLFNPFNYHYDGRIKHRSSILPVRSKPTDMP
ncbi:hypothetical protein M5689_000746 [Euphorbia peplus]|nr:hypothetical protein M5689_000746 [Euphorbia peplus]